jgi:hypothetical protein
MKISIKKISGVRINKQHVIKGANQNVRDDQRT